MKRITEALQAYILFESAHGMIVPVPQFNQFEHLSSPAMSADRVTELRDHWDELAKERDGYLEGTLEALISK